MRQRSAVGLLLLNVLPVVLLAQSVQLTEATIISLLRGTTKIQELPSWEACQARARELATADTRTSGTVTYRCQTEVRRLVATYSAAPVPVDCAVSAFTLQSATPWSACANGVQTRTETWTRTVTTPPSGGGTPCPALVETRTGTQACTPPGEGVVFQDRFEYVSERAATSDAAFRAAGWNNAKSHGFASGARGYVYTTASIPGFTGAFPGGGSRVLALEGLAQTLQGQTDFYLQVGNEQTPERIPGDVWFQFWVYPQDALDQRSFHTLRNKFFYASNDAFPSHSHKWMLGSKPFTYNPLLQFPHGNPSATFWITLSSAAGVSNLVYAGPGADPDISDEIGPQALTHELTPNRWWLVKMHMDTSTTAGQWQMWIKAPGGAWQTVADWRHGVNGLTWTIPAASVGGHRMLRIPTTVGSAGTDLRDYWMYLDDFVIARTEAALPVYQ